MGNADEEAADGRLATFAILSRPTPTSISLIGTGFYLQPKGGLANGAGFLFGERRSVISAAA
jgi:hypothetical protein